jgi:hypothetical protein
MREMRRRREGTNGSFQTADSGHQSAYSRQQTVDSRQQIADSRRQIAGVGEGTTETLQAGDAVEGQLRGGYP